jgi:hypothetical protein
MNHSKFKTLSLLVLGLLALAGCGGSSSNSGSSSDPLATNNQTPVTAPTATGSGTVLSYTMSLTTTSPSGETTVGSNSTVIAKAIVKDNNGNLVANQSIKFEEIIPPPDTAASVSIPQPIVATTSEGIAINLMRALETDTNKDVIIKASTSINGEAVGAISTFKIVRSAGNYINFITTKTITDPDGNLNIMNREIDNQPAGSLWAILQLVTFQVLDKNGVPRTQVPVKVSIYSVLGNCSLDTIIIDNPEFPLERTVTTDNTGLGIFNAEVILPAAAPGGSTSCSVIYKATTPDIYSAEPQNLFSYGGYIANLKNNKP